MQFTVRFLRAVSVLLSIACFSPAGASVLEMVGAPSSTISAGGVDVPIHKEARVNGVPVYLTGSGIRSEKVGPFKVKVYVATSYTDDKAGISHTDPMGSITKAKFKAVQMTMVHDATAAQIKDAFQSSLEMNDIDINMPDIKAMFDKLTDDIASGSKVTFTNFHDAHDNFDVEAPGTGYTTETEGFSDLMWKMWFGKVDDLGQELKDALIGAFSFFRM